MPVPAAHDRWAELRALTPARVGLGRSGAGLPTQAALRFALDHARAKDAVHAAFDVATIVSRIGEIGHEAIAVTSRAGGRGEYLQRPDLGRQLDNTSRQLLCAREDGRDRVVIVAGDGLSPAGVNAHAVSLIERLLPRLSTAGVAVGPIIVATGSRVALGDDIGESLGAHLVVMLIGERPGLSAPDSLGVYLTYAPRIGCKDADRNCVSNIHSHGLTCEAASAKTAWLVREALLRQMTGVRLKDESELDGLLGTQTTGKVASIAVAETEKSSSFSWYLARGELRRCDVPFVFGIC